MAKMAKKIQTDYTKGGRDISNTAIPYYQNTLTTLNDYIQDPYAQIDTIMDKYYSNNAMQGDFLRNYNRAMANTSANNFASTGGGYSSSGQRAYNDQQRYQNDLASRLQQYGVGQAFAGQNQLYGQALAGAGAFHNAYNTGKEYSDIEQYNNLADQNNSFWNQALGIGGQVLNAGGQVAAALTGNPALANASVLGNIASSQVIDPGYALNGQASGQGSGWADSVAKVLSVAGSDWLDKRKANQNADSSWTDFLNRAKGQNTPNTNNPWGFNQSSNSSPFKMNW